MQFMASIWNADERHSYGGGEFSWPFTSTGLHSHVLYVCNPKGVCERYYYLHCSIIFQIKFYFHFLLGSILKTNFGCIFYNFFNHALCLNGDQ